MAQRDNVVDSFTGELHLSKSGWLLLSVPNALGQGYFAALHEPGVELPTDEEGRYNAHISVATAEEVSQIGGDNITERGKHFAYTIKGIRKVVPDGWSEMEAVWLIEVNSPALEKLRRSYGLSTLPKDGKHKFHCTFAVRRRRVLGNNDIAKSPSLVEAPKKSSTPTFKFHDRPGTHLIKASSGALILRATDRAVRQVFEKQSGTRDAFRSLLEPEVRQWLGRQGLAWGQFHPNQNWVDTMEQGKFMDTQNEAMRLAAQQDSSPMKILHGFHSLLGGKWDPSMAEQDSVLQKGYAAIAPHLQRWSPKFFDQLHGGQSSASLAAAIAEAHRYRDPDMQASEAARLANSIMKKVQSDPMQHRRFTSQELGDIYREASKRGWISRSAIKGNAIDEKKITEDIGTFADAASAIRDSTANSATPMRDMHSIFDHFDKMRGQYPGQSIAQIASNIRDQHELGRTGGLMGNALRRSNITLGHTGDTTLETLNAQNSKLMGQARDSSVGRMVGATQRLKDQKLFAPGSAADKFLDKARAGGLTRADVDNWSEMLVKNKVVSQSTAELMLSDTDNSRALTPDMITGLRASQGNIDIQPFLEGYDKSYNNKNDPGGIIRRSLKNQFLQPHGYANVDDYNLLHGANAKNFVTSMQDAHQRGQYAQSQSGVGWQAPVARLSEGLQAPNPTLGSVGKSFMNLQPTPPPPPASVPNAPDAPGGMPKPPPGTFASAATAPPTPPTDGMPTPPAGTFAAAPTPPAAPEPVAPAAPEAPGMTVMAMFKEAIGPGYRGIPNRNDMGDLGKLAPEDIIDMIISRHDAVRAGTHRDLRIGDKDRGLYSWAMRAEGMPEPGRKVLANQQPIHAHAYGSFQGSLGPGYGQGTVRRERKGRVLVTSATPTKIEFTEADKGDQRFVLFKPAPSKDPNKKGFGDRAWLMMNTTLTKPLPYEKPHYKVIAPEDVEPFIDSMQNGTSYQQKIDGAHNLVALMNHGIEVLSYRTSKKGTPLVHTERMFGGRPKSNYPSNLEGSVLRSEVYGRQDGKSLSPQATGGLLNANLEHSLQKQKAQGSKLMGELFDIQRYGKKTINPNEVPYSERRKMMEELLPYLPKDRFELSQQHFGPEAGKQLWRDVIGGNANKTHEGIVAHPELGPPVKMKQFQEWDVPIVGTSPGLGRLANRGIGSLVYSDKPEGAPVGEIGSGLSDELRQHAFTNPEAYIGRLAKIRAQEKFPSGAYRAPSLLAMRED